MKKTIAILMVFVVVAGMAFATTNVGDATLKVLSYVEKRYPGFKLNGVDQATGGENVDSTLGLSWTDETQTAYGDDETHGTYSNGEGTINAKMSISEADITVLFTLTQTGSEGVDQSDNSRYARMTNAYDFDITVGNMVLLDNGGAQITSDLVENTNYVKPNTGITYTKGTVADTQKLTITTPETGAEFHAVYNGIVKDDQEIGHFEVTWPATATLVEGNYEADVTVTISYT